MSHGLEDLNVMLIHASGSRCWMQWVEEPSGKIGVKSCYGLELEAMGQVTFFWRVLDLFRPPR